MLEYLNDIIFWLVNTIGRLGYPGIFFLMFLESTFFPLPSELIIPPAAYLAAQGKMNIFLIVALGIMGNIFGALFNYFLSIKLGRPLIIKMLKSVGLGEKSYQKTEYYFKEHGEISTFIGRLIPGIRHYISMPAGLARMDLKKFIVFTAIGCGIWDTILAFIGYYIGYNQGLIMKYSNQVLFYMLIFIVMLLFFYIWWYKKWKKKSTKK